MRGMARHFIVSSMNRHGVSVLGAVAIAVVIATTGCSAALTTHSAPEQGKDPSTLTLLAELALERGDCRVASDDYAAAAQQSGVAVARRASEVGLACENLPAAWQSAQRWRALAPADPDAATSYAAIAVKLYKIPAAIAAAQTVVQTAGANANERIGQLATALLEEAEAPAVLAVISAAAGPKPSPETLTLLAQLSLEAFDPERAQRYAEQAYQLAPNLTAAKQILARVYVMQSDAPKAIDTAREVMVGDPKNYTFELAEILIALDRREEARQELERLRAAGASSAEVDQRLALLAFQEGDLPEAQRRFSTLASRGEVGEGVILYLADIAARDGDKAAALAGYRQLENSSLALTARTRAAAILLPDNRAAAFALLDDYAVAHPEESFELTLTKVHLLSDHDETDAGLALLQAALERHPKHPALEYERAVLLERAGNVPESVATLDRLIAERPDDPTLLNALGYTLADHSEELPRAEKLIRRALVFSPDNPAVLDSLGWVRFRRGDARSAAPILAHAYALGQDSDIAAHLGEALWQSGDQTQARNVWARALARDPSAALVKSTMARLLPSAKS
jgi:Flp pilus assembly protein TadD